MSFKKSNIYFDEKPTKGSKNAITSGAVAESSSGIPIYKTKGKFQISNPTSASLTEISISLTFNDNETAKEFAKKHIVFGVSNFVAYSDSAYTTRYAYGDYVTAGIKTCYYSMRRNESTSVEVVYSATVTPTFTMTGILYYDCDVVFLDENDLTKFE